MKNPILMLKRESSRAFRVVVVGDTYQGPKRGIHYLPSQPRRGLSRAKALALASEWTPARVVSFCAKREGSYVYPSVRPLLSPVTKVMRGGFKFERSAVPTIDTRKNERLAAVPTAADLIMKRREALRTLSEIDAKLEKMLELRAVKAIQRGMAAPLNNSTTLQ